MDVGVASGWDVWELEDGKWAWTVWSQGRLGPGIAFTEVEAQTSAQRELERLVDDDAAAEQHRRELPADGTRPADWDRQFWPSQSGRGVLIVPR